MIKRIKPGKRLSGAIVHGNTVYLSGQVPDDHTADIASQTKQILDKIDALLSEAGTDKANIVSATIWLTNIGDKDDMNVVWDEWIGAMGPARACVQSALASPEIKVEIAVIAAIC